MNFLIYLFDKCINIVHSPFIKGKTVVILCFFVLTVFSIVKTFIISRVEVIVKLYSVNIIVSHNFFNTFYNQVLSFFTGRIKINSIISFNTYGIIFYIWVIIRQFFRNFFTFNSVWVYPSLNSHSGRMYLFTHIF